MITVFLVALYSGANSMPRPVWHPSTETQIKRFEKKKSAGAFSLYRYASKKIARNATNPVANYYLADYYLQLISSDTSARNAYRNFSRCLSHARKFERYGNAGLTARLKWDESREQIDSLYQEMAKVLSASGEIERFDLISSKYGRLKNAQVSELASTPASADVVYDEATKFTVDGYAKGPFFGMPSGNEKAIGSFESEEWKLLEIINKARIEKGLDPLKMQPDLVRAARYHAVDMATQDYFSHNSYDRVGEELREIGTTFPRIRTFYNETFVNSENLAAGSSDPEGTYDQWFNSPGHNRNMFNKSSKFVGLGVAFDPNSSFKYYWVFCTAM
ncbi:MAG: CAP domain-containing protein [Flavobacteriales bacterium]|nr:CAP domain-containing protein [Bacteroidota bacterium]MCB9239827.1 CAP domain-containing protein [Flavobacteriales bacterium]